MQTTITIQGTHCNACKMLIEDVCRDISSVKSCTVNFKTGETVVQHDETLNWGTFKKEIESIGTYRVLFSCPECGLRYDARPLAAQCQQWCAQHHSCNIEITKHAIKDS